MTDFSSLFRRTDAYQSIKRDKAQGRLSHAYLIVGEDFSSNNAFCRAMALKLVCQKNMPCLECAPCKKILAGFHPDVFVYPKGKSFVVADSEDILANVAIRPFESDYKIFLVNEIDKATPAAQNKLLKTVEEAPKNVVFLFNATNAQNVLQTIKSRTAQIAIENYTQLPLEKQPDYAFLVDMIQNMQSSRQTLKYAVKFAEKTGFLARLELLGELFEKMLYEKLGNGDVFGAVKNTYSEGAIAEILGQITLAKQQFLANVGTNLITDNLLLKILEVRFKWNQS